MSWSTKSSTRSSRPTVNLVTCTRLSGDPDLVPRMITRITIRRSAPARTCRRTSPTIGCRVSSLSSRSRACPNSSDLYWIGSANEFFPIPASIRFYYFLGTSGPGQPVAPFPEGLRMLAGSPDNKQPSQIVEFECHLDPHFVNNSFATDFNFNTPCAGGLRVDVYFPQCWDGFNLYKADQSHMAYVLGPSYPVNGQCPLSHPIRLPTIMTEYTYHPEMVFPNSTMAGNLAWANGDTTGYGAHADFVNGWDLDVLSAALNSSACGIGESLDMPFAECPVFAPHIDASAASACKPEKGVLQESFGNADYVSIPRLPGCNPLWGATGSKPTCSPRPPALDVTPFEGTVESYVTDTPVGFTLPTTPGWSLLACLSNPPFGSSVNYYDNEMTVQSCQQSCYVAGFPYAATGVRGAGNFQCICGTTLDPAMSPISPGSCSDPCPGNSSQTCGGVQTYNVYYAPNGTTMAVNQPTYASGAEYVGCLDTNKPQTSTYTFTSNTMTTQVCNQACTARNATWSATTEGNICFCGNSFTSASTTPFVPDSNCQRTCFGNSSQICGDTFYSSIYNITAATFAPSNVTHLSGWKGCYVGPSSVLPGYTYSSNDMTQSQCVNGCGEIGYKFAGLINGNDCLCSNATISTQQLPPSQCATACMGNSSLVCGGNNNIDLYSTSGYLTLAQVAATKPKAYLGCFLDQSYAPTLTNYSYSSSSMTVEMCVGACSEFGYPYAGVESGSTCKCGSKAPNTTEVPTGHFCTTACAGSPSSETCGGSGYLEAYQVSVANNSSSSSSSSSSYAGCWSNSPMGLTSYSFSMSMTIDICRTGCNEIGYSLASLDSGNTCRCGNSWKGGERLPDSSCTTACTGNSKQICGTTSSASLYNTTGALPIAARPAGWLGCYQDAQTRALNGWSYSSSSMTTDTCQVACGQQNATLAGAEAGVQCFCGNSINPSLRVPQVTCNVPCSGEANVTCGASYKLDVYNTTVTSVHTASNGTSTTGPSTSSTTCYTDYNVLNGVSYVSDIMSLDICNNYCFAYNSTYAGVRNGNTCTCGMTSPSQVAPVSQCGTACSANSAQICGTSSVVNVVKLASVSQLSSTGFSLKPNSTGYVGCFSEGSSTRLLPYYAVGTSSLTNQMCIDNCHDLGYAYAGTEIGLQCFCGSAPSALVAGSHLVQDSDCSTPCSGNSSSVCGASGKLSVWDLSVAKATPAPVLEGHKGCFAWGTFSSSGGPTYSTVQMTPGLCRQTCRYQGYTYAGLNRGAQCTCGNIASYGAEIAPVQCGVQCSGDSTVSCGGNSQSAWDIYDTTGAQAYVNTTGFSSNYEGCFTAAPLNATSYTTSPGMTNGLCSTLCSQKGFAVSGTEDGSRCFCGPSLPLAMVASPGSCGTSCAGQSSTMCGGNGYWSLYSSVNQGAMASISTASSSSSHLSSTSSTSSIASSLSKVSSTSTVSASTSTISRSTSSSSSTGASVTTSSSIRATVVAPVSSSSSASTIHSSSATSVTTSHAASSTASPTVSKRDFDAFESRQIRRDSRRRRRQHATVHG